MVSTGNTFFSSNYSDDFSHCGRRNQYYEEIMAVCKKQDTSVSPAVLRRSSRLHSIWLQHHHQFTKVSGVSLSNLK